LGVGKEKYEGVLLFLMIRVKKRILFVVVYLLVLSISSIAPTFSEFQIENSKECSSVKCFTLSESSEPRVEGWAVILEQDDYPGTEYDLPVGFVNSIRLQEALLNLGWKSDHMYVRHDNVTQEAAQEGVLWLINNTRPRDIALFYVSGHGGGWVTVELGWNDWFPEWWTYVNTSRRILMVDTCLSGEYIAPVRNDPRPHVSLSACAEDELSWGGLEEEGLPIIGSVWNCYITNAMCNSSADIDSNGFISIEEAHNFSTPLVQKYMNETVFTVPEFLEMYHELGVYPEHYTEYPHPLIDDQYSIQLYLNLSYYEFDIRVPYDYLTIQEAINNASEGDMIYVHNGTYFEHVIVNKTVSLIGENKNIAIIDGMDIGTVLNVTAYDVTVTGFTIQNSGSEWLYTLDSGILIQSSNNHIENNVISSNSAGILLNRSDNNLLISNNVSSNRYGIILKNSRDNTIISNVVLSNKNRGIGFSNSNNNALVSNNVSSNYFGIYLVNSTINIVFRNYISRSEHGVRLEQGSNENTFYRNTVSLNDWLAIQLESSNSSKIFHNNFINNTNQVSLFQSFNNSWDNGCEGNYWSDYNGTDLDGDGVGDTNLPWQSVDMYPLMILYMEGDVNHDGKVDMLDIGLACWSYGATPSDERWNCHCDLNEDEKIDMKDIGITCLHYGETNL
jgi:nitrous oxidase accessory protein